MGLLDELEQEAQRRKESMGDADRAKEERVAAYKTLLEPGMQALHEYLSKLIANLSFLKPKTQVRHDIPSYGTIVAYLEHEYDLKANKLGPTSKEIVLQFNAAVAQDECPNLEVEGAQKIRTTNGFFQKYRLAGLQEFKKDDSGEMVKATFRARGKIPMTVTVNADAESGQVRMTFTNFDVLGVASKQVPPAQFNEQLFDEIGRFISRQQNSLFRESLSDDYRRALQQKIQQDNLKRKWEAKIAEQQAAEEAKKNPRVSGARPRANTPVPSAPPAAADKAPSLLDRITGIFKK